MIYRQTKNGILLKGDCLEILPKLKKPVDMILCDLPYGTTQNKWDSIIDLPSLWAQYKRLTKGAVVLSAQTPFDKVLGCSNLDMLKYEWIWEKENGTGHLNAKKMPMKNHENVLVFYKEQCIYNPQFTDGKAYKQKSGKQSSNYGDQIQIVTDNAGIRYPLSVQKVPRDKDKVHPTQKPVALFEYLIRTYTNEGMTVLDNCAGSGTTAIACENIGRKWICIEREEKYCEIIAKRLESCG
jgi:site-specific DNA-methyltransferase (adenine-specific)